ncbi:MAG: SH3 domain-containing protein [Candidatus Riflebacteria bacterium]|nr:SH3 domain-containing protein [Candidatus Riflebacteria bacterium]
MKILFVSIFLFLFSSVSEKTVADPKSTNKKGNMSLENDNTFRQFELKIPGVVEEMLNSSFWVNLIDEPDRIIMNQKDIEHYNRRNLRECKSLKDLRTYRRAVSGKSISEMILKVSSKPSKKRYLNGKELDDNYYDSLISTLNIQKIPDLVSVRFGITLKRTEMRTFPTFDRVFSEPDDYEFDRFIETALYPIEPLVILHESADGKWFFAQSFNYLAWVPADDVVIADKTTLFDYLDTSDFLVVTGKKAFTGFNPMHPEISELQFDMGVKIPLARREEIPMDIYGQHPAGNYVVKVPVRGEGNKLELRLALISRADDVRVNYLPFTRRNIISQAFKFLGQRYGWGGMFNTRDCSAFIMDNFRSMGILLPRNANEQGKLAVGITHDLPDGMGIDERKKLFDGLPPATPIYMDGHAMLYLCKYDNDYYIIHDFAGFSAPDESGQLVRSKTRGVCVTPLLATFLSKNKEYIKGIYSAREFTLGN